MSNFCKTCNENVEAEVDEQEGHSFCALCGLQLDDLHFESGPSFVRSGDSAHLAGTNIRNDDLSKDGAGMGGKYGEDSRERSVNKGRYWIRNFANQLQVPEMNTYIEQATNVYILAMGNGFTRGRRTNQVAAACLYTVLRQDRRPYMLIDFCHLLSVNVYVLGSTYIRLTQKLRFDTHPVQVCAVDPSLYLHRFAGKLKLPEKKLEEVVQTGMLLIAQMKRDWMQTGRRPAGVCGAALWLACHIHGIQLSRKDVIKVVSVGESTMMHRITELRNTTSSQMTLVEYKEHAKLCLQHQKDLEANRVGALTQPDEPEPEGEREGQPLLPNSGACCRHVVNKIKEELAFGMCQECYTSYIQASGGIVPGAADPPAFTRNLRKEVKQMQQLAREDAFRLLTSSTNPLPPPSSLALVPVDKPPDPDPGRDPSIPMPESASPRAILSAPDEHTDSNPHAIVPYAGPPDAVDGDPSATDEASPSMVTTNTRDGSRRLGPTRSRKPAPPGQRGCPLTGTSVQPEGEPSTHGEVAALPQTCGSGGAGAGAGAALAAHKETSRKRKSTRTHSQKTDNNDAATEDDETWTPEKDGDGDAPLPSLDVSPDALPPRPGKGKGSRAKKVGKAVAAGGAVDPLEVEFALALLQNEGLKRIAEVLKASRVDLPAVDVTQATALLASEAARQQEAERQPDVEAEDRAARLQATLANFAVARAEDDMQAAVSAAQAKQATKRAAESTAHPRPLDPTTDPAGPAGPARDQVYPVATAPESTATVWSDADKAQARSMAARYIDIRNGRDLRLVSDPVARTFTDTMRARAGDMSQQNAAKAKEEAAKSGSGKKRKAADPPAISLSFGMPVDPNAAIPSSEHPDDPSEAEDAMDDDNNDTGGTGRELVQSNNGEVAEAVPVRDDLSDIDDEDIMQYIASEEEAALKKDIWAVCNREWLEAQAAKEAAAAEAAEAAAKAAASKPPPRKRARVRFQPGESAEASVLNMFESKHMGAKVNKDVVHKLFQAAEQLAAQPPSGGGGGGAMMQDEEAMEVPLSPGARERQALMEEHLRSVATHTEQKSRVRRGRHTAALEREGIVTPSGSVAGLLGVGDARPVRQRLGRLSRAK